MRWSRLPIVVGLVLGLPACSDPSSSVGPVVLEAGAPLYSAAAVVTLTVRNLSSDELQYSQCFPNLEEQGGDSTWRTIHEDASPCLGILEVLGGYATRVAQVRLPSDLAGGTYRVRFPMIGAPPDQHMPFVVAAQLGGDFGVRP
jgi:hypothetical protein